MDEAIDHFQKAGKYWEASEKLNPGLSRNRRRKAEVDAGIAEAHQIQGNYKPAIAAFSSALATFQEERKREPKDASLLNEQPRV